MRFIHKIKKKNGEWEAISCKNSLWHVNTQKWLKKMKTGNNNNNRTSFTCTSTHFCDQFRSKSNINTSRKQAIVHVNVNRSDGVFHVFCYFSSKCKCIGFGALDKSDSRVNELVTNLTLVVVVFFSMFRNRAPVH